MVSNNFSYLWSFKKSASKPFPGLQSKLLDSLGWGGHYPATLSPLSRQKSKTAVAWAGCHLPLSSGLVFSYLPQSPSSPPLRHLIISCTKFSSLTYMLGMRIFYPSSNTQLSSLVSVFPHTDLRVRVSVRTHRPTHACAHTPPLISKKEYYKIHYTVAQILKYSFLGNKAEWQS